MAQEADWCGDGLYFVILLSNPISMKILKSRIQKMVMNAPNTYCLDGLRFWTRNWPNSPFCFFTFLYSWTIFLLYFAMKFVKKRIELKFTSSSLLWSCLLWCELRLPVGCSPFWKRVKGVEQVYMYGGECVLLQGSFHESQFHKIVSIYVTF